MNRLKKIGILVAAGLMLTTTGAVAAGVGDFVAPTTGTSNSALDRRLDAVEAWIEKNDVDAVKPSPTATATPTPTVTVTPKPTVTATPTPTPTSTSTSNEQVLYGFVTGYTFADNDPPYSNAIAYEDVRPGTGAGGIGTYDNPVTVAVKTTAAHAPGTKFYLPNLRRYFIVEDACSTSHSAPSGCTSDFDVWIDGRGTADGGDKCMYAQTGNHNFIKNPRPDYVTVTGTGTVASDCRQWGETAVLK